MEVEVEVEVEDWMGKKQGVEKSPLFGKVVPDR